MSRDTQLVACMTSRAGGRGWVGGDAIPAATLCEQVSDSAPWVQMDRWGDSGRVILWGLQLDSRGTCHKWAK